MKRLFVILMLVLIVPALVYSQAATKKSNSKVKKATTESAKKDSVEFKYSALLVVNSKACACTRRNCEAAQAILDSLNLKEKGVKLEIVDYGTEQEKATQLIKQYGFSFLPTVLVFDKDGKEIKRWSGILNKEEAKVYFENLGKPETTEEKKQ